MDCEKIQAVLSEYLDRTLINDLNRTVKEHLLACKKCGNIYFSMKSMVEELADLERIKAPDGFLNSVNQAVDKRLWFKDTLNIFSGFKIPMEFVTLATTAVLIILIFTNLQSDKNNNNMIPGPDRTQTAFNNTIDRTVSGTDPVDLDFYMHRKHVSTDNVFTVGTESHLRGNDITDFFTEIDDNFPFLRREKTISDINELILLMEGDVLSRDYQLDSALPDIITVKIPSGNYEAFMKEIKKFGNFKPPAPSLTDNPPDSVFLKMRLNLQE
ncbi:zf-HC2 domain-containing protein [Thermodesulfobacteriota bacterium]